MKQLIVLLLFILAQISLSENSGAKIAFDRNFLTNIGSDLLPILNKKIKSTKIPDYSKKYGPVKLKAYNFKMDFKLQENSFSFKLADPNQVVLKLKDVKGSITLLAKTSLGLIKKTCRVNVSFDVDGTVPIELSREQVKDSTLFVPMINIKTVDAKYGIKVNIKGGLIGSIANLFKGDIAKAIRKEVEKQVKNLKEKANDSIKNLIRKYLPKLEMDNGLIANFSIAEEPHLIDSQVFSFNSLFSFVAVEEKKISPIEQIYDYSHNKSFLSFLQDSPLPDFDPESNELQLFFGLDSFNEYLNSYFAVNRLTVIVDEDERNNKIPGGFIDKYISKIFKGITTSIGGMNIRIKAEFPKAPVLQLQDKTISGTLESIVHIISDKDAKMETLSTSNVTLRFNATGELVKGRGFAQINEIVIEKLVTALKNDTDAQMMKEFLNEFFLDLIGQFNEACAEKLEIKEIVTKKAIIRDPTVKIREGYVHVGASPELNLD